MAAPSSAQILSGTQWSPKFGVRREPKETVDGQVLGEAELQAVVFPLSVLKWDDVLDEVSNLDSSLDAGDVNGWLLQGQKDNKLFYQVREMLHDFLVVVQVSHVATSSRAH